MSVWDEVLQVVRTRVDTEDYRRWFGVTSYASDSGDQITVWVPSEAIRRHLETHFGDQIRRALAGLGRAGTHVRFAVAGFGDEEEDEEAD